MTIVSGLLKYKDNQVHCLRMGQGPKLLIAFHGFGNTAEIFVPLATQLQQEYTIVAIDIPGHGKTIWKDTHFKKRDLMAIIQGIKIDFGVEKFSLAGFSLGGRVCLNVAEVQPNWIDNLVLIAPDGLEKNFWYNAATRNVFGKIIFNKMMQNPEQWLNRVDFLRRYKLIDESRFKFAKSNLTNKEVRHQLSYVWPVTSRLIINIHLVKWNLNKFKVKTQVFMGKHDRIFPPEQGERFINKLKIGELTILDAGHQLLHESLVAHIAKAFK